MVAPSIEHEANARLSPHPHPVWRLLLKGIAFLALNAFLAVVVLKVHESTLHYAPWETDSILLPMPEDGHTDLVFLGTSRAYLFSRFEEHHVATESALGRSVFNMALPQGGGIKPARFYLESYFEAGNTAGRVVYFIDPFVFFSAGANEDHKFVYFEPFRFRLLAKFARNGYNYQQVVSYVRSKFSRTWLFQKPEVLVHHTAHTRPEYLNADRIQQRIASLYPDGQPAETATVYAREFARVAAVCETNNTPLMVVVLPTLLGPEPGHAWMMAMLHSMEKLGTTEVYDWVSALSDYRLFYNLDHMNLGGVEKFMWDYMRPALDAADAPLSNWQRG